ncbi:hypothetical protein LCGC14_2116760 [marine sediment metagenome]|uniref:Carbohydrate-binding module family 96 domain-containing protein n=1 Tax=marine sediment metagenome TaxID=412755 RepID=A0A0F9E5K5_9ZZZZ
MKNKKLITLTTSILFLMIFGIFLIPIAKATKTYTTEEHSTTKDAWIYDLSPDLNTGNYPYWNAGYDGYDIDIGSMIAFFGFNISDMPENTIKVQIKIPVAPTSINGDNIYQMFFYSTENWDESTITYNNAPNTTTYMMNIIPNLAIFISMISIYYILDITSKISEDEITIITRGRLYESSLDEYPLTGYTKESGELTLVPSIIYTIENEIIPPQNNEILFLVIGLIGGVGIGCVVVGIIAFLNKRKTKI